MKLFAVFLTVCLIAVKASPCQKNSDPGSLIQADVNAAVNLGDGKVGDILDGLTNQVDDVVETLPVNQIVDDTGNLVDVDVKANLLNGGLGGLVGNVVNTLLGSNDNTAPPAQPSGTGNCDKPKQPTPSGNCPKPKKSLVNANIGLGIL